MVISLLVISSTSYVGVDVADAPFFTARTKAQLQWFGLGWVAYFFCAGLDYQKLREWTWIVYGVMIVLLIGLFLTPAIQNVHRWYRVPGLGFEFQPSEYAKLAVVLALSWFIEQKGRSISSLGSALQAGMIAFVPFVLILKQPDLGTALVLYPITLVMFYFGGVHPRLLKLMKMGGLAALLSVVMIFTGVVSHEKIKPLATAVIKEYQYERLNPETYHQKASQTAIALGKYTGAGWRRSQFTGRKWLPAASTDSVFAAFAEEFGVFGVFLIMSLFFALIYFSFQVTALAKDGYGRLLSAGITVYLAMHIIVNIGMMCGFLPITGVPLTLVTYGGSSILSTMAALGILQSIYSRRFMF